MKGSEDNKRKCRHNTFEHKLEWGETPLHTISLEGQLIRVQLFNDDISVHSPSQLFPRTKSITIFICKPLKYSFIRD